MSAQIKLEAVSICIGYGDFLAEVAPINRHIMDRWIVVTSPDDTETRDVCHQHSIDVLLSDDGGDQFRKGRLIERGLRQLSKDAWRLHIDADIALPANTRNWLATSELQTDCIYGVDRVMIKSYADWLKAKDYLITGHHDYHYRLRWPKYEVGARWADTRVGYVPLGYFQLWHSTEDTYKGARVKPYPQDHGDACRSDVQHSLQFDRSKRVLIPEIIALHLESQPSALGANWKGRTTPRFGPKVVKQQECSPS